MEQERKAIRVGMTVIVCTLLFRLCSFLLPMAVEFLTKPEVISFLIYMETGRVVKLQVGPTQPVVSTEPETIPSTEWTEPREEKLSFHTSDAELVQLRSTCKYPVDVEAMLMTQLVWDLKKTEPTVLIIHSHGTESYTQTPEAPYQETAAYRTLDSRNNMVRVGEELREALLSYGITAIHDTETHDYPSYTDAYSNSRKSVEKYLGQYPTISLIVDLHRDAAEISGNQQLSTQAEVKGITSAQLMLVVGSDASGRNHPNWEKNMALAVKMHALLQKQYPGLCRPISFRTERFNQDLSPGALLIEVGAAGDTLEKALVAVRALAEGIAELADGTAIGNSTS